MFFRRRKPEQLTLEQRLQRLKDAGFAVEAAGDRRYRVSRNQCATVLEAQPDGTVRPIQPAGIVLGGEIASLVDGGYQKFFQTPSGKRKPALAEELRNVHDFVEDLRASLGMITLYNEALGTVSTFYLYDRVQDRDRGVPRRVWE